MCSKQLLHVLSGALVLLGVCLPAYTQAPSTISEDGKALDSATQGLCNTQIAMMGEIATHGDGHTLAFKIALVERLVDQCGFNAVFFEANQEEFIHLNHRLRSGDAVTPADLLTAVGGIWKFYREFQPLAPFLLTRAQSGRVFLGGLDDQLGQLGQNYANIEMITELTDLLPESKRKGCNAALHNRIFSQYSETAPYSAGVRSQIDNCLEEIQAASNSDATATVQVKEERREMISATKRWIGRDFSSEGESIANRDRSMFQTFEWLQSRLPTKHKTIIWAATVHVAKRGDPAWGDRAGTNLGLLIHRKYGNRARSLGFSTISGSFRQGKGKFATVPVAPADSVEVQALKGTDTSAAYLDTKQSAAMGVRQGAFFYHSYQTLAWSDFLDGVVVFRTERPPTDMR